MFEEGLHGVLVGFGQLLDQVFDRVHSLFVVRTFCSRDRELLPHKESAPVWQQADHDYSLMALTKSLKNPYVKSGSGSSLKNIFRAPVVTWMSSHLLSLRSSCSSVDQPVSAYEPVCV